MKRELANMVKGKIHEVYHSGLRARLYRSVYSLSIDPYMSHSEKTKMLKDILEGVLYLQRDLLLYKDIELDAFEISMRIASKCQEKSIRVLEDNELLTDHIYGEPCRCEDG